MSVVGFTKINETSIESLKKSINKLLDLIDYSFPKYIKNVVIKPNMCYYWDYTTGQTTNPKIVGALIDLIRERFSSSPKFFIVESDASAMKCKYAFKFLGYEKLANDYDVTLINLSEDKSEKIKVKVGTKCLNLMIPQTIRNSDLKINVPKIKFFGRVKFSGVLKNIFGCNPEPNKYKYHLILDKTIIAINKIMNFDIHILDGIIVVGSKTRKLNLIIASQDPVALDAAASKIAGLNPKSISYLTLAQKEGLGNISFTSRGEDPKIFERLFPKKKLKDKILQATFKIAKQTHIIDTAWL